MNIKKIIWRFVGPIILILISFIFGFLGKTNISEFAALFGIALLSAASIATIVESMDWTF